VTANKSEKYKHNLNINEIIEQMKQNDNNDANSNVILSNSSQAIINTTDFELRLINDKTSGSVTHSKNSTKPATKPRKYVKKEKEDGESKPVNSNESAEPKPIAKRRKSAQKQGSDQIQDPSQIAASASNSKTETVRNRKTSSFKSSKNSLSKLNTDEFKLDEEEEASLNGNVTNNTIHPINPTSVNLSTIEDHSSCSTSSQQDEEIKELLMRKNDSINGTLNSFGGIIINNEITASNLAVSKSKALKIHTSKSINADLKNSNLNANTSNIINAQQPSDTTSPSISFANKIITEELKELIQKEKQTTADLFLQLQLLKNKEDQINTNNFVNSFSNSIGYMHQNSNSSDISISELVNINTKENGNSNQHNQFNQRIKSATPVFVDQLLMSPLFNSFMPSCGSSSSSNSSSSTNTNVNSHMQQQNSVVTSFSQMAAAVSAVLNNTNNNNNNSSKSTPSSSPTINLESGLIKINPNQSSFKRTKENVKGIFMQKFDMLLNNFLYNFEKFKSLLYCHVDSI